MSKICKSCNHINPDYAHYCTSCGKPLEREGYANRDDKIYIVVSKTEYENNKRELQRLKREQQKLKDENNSLKNNWWYKFCQWLKKIEWEDVWWAGGSMIIFPAVVFILCIIPWGSCSGGKDNLQIQFDKTTGKYGIFNNKEEEWTTQPAFDSIIFIKNTDDNYFILFNDSKYGVADSSGIITVQCDLDSLGYRSYNGVRITYSNKKEGLIETCSGIQILPCKFYRVLWMHEPRYYSSESAGKYVGNIIPALETGDLDRWSLYNRQGERIDTVSYSDVAQTNHPDLIKVQKYVKCPQSTRYSVNGKSYRICPSDWGIVNSNGKVVFQFQFENLYSVHEDCIWGRKKWNEPYCCYSVNGAKIFTLSSKDMSPDNYHEGLAAVYYNGHYGFYDKIGNLTIPFKYQRYKIDKNATRTMDFYDGKAYVSYNGQNGTIDKNGVFTPEK